MTDIGGSATPARKRGTEGHRMSGNCDGAVGFGIKKHSMVRTMAALKITYKDPGQLRPRARNPRTHTAKQIKQIAACIKEFGFINPILTDGADGIIAGHGRVEAAKLIGINDVPTVRVDHLTPAQIRAYVIADNKLAENAGWDQELPGTLRRRTIN
jgi:ParB-like nuclease domain